MNTNQKLRTFDLIREAVLPEYRDRVAEYLVLYEEALHDANARPDEVRDMPVSGTVSKMLSLRFPVEELAAMELVASRAGLTRAQWIKRTLRWQLWTRAGELRLVPSSHRAIIKLVSQVRAIGRSLNQAVKAMNAANRPQSPLEIQRIAAEVIAMEDRISQLVNDAAAGLTEILSGEVYYWTGRERKLPSIIGTAR